MAVPLKRVNLMLDEPLLRRLKDAARREQTSVSSLVRRLLARDLGLAQSPADVAAELHRLRNSLPPMPDSTAEVRASRDRGW
jgi:hypothetical protein